MKPLAYRMTALAAMLIATVLACVGLVTRADYSSSAGYTAAILDKHARLSTLESPKLVLIGGSGVAFSVDSPRLEETFHLPVANMGVHANIGLRWMLAEVKPFVRSGDVIVVVPEFEQFENNLNGSGAMLVDTLLTLPGALGYVESLQQVKTLPEALIPKIVANTMAAVRQSVGRTRAPAAPVEPWYQRRGFNEQGDVVAHLLPANQELVRSARQSGRSRVVRQSVEPLGEMHDEIAAIGALNRFSDAVAARGARPLFAYPCVPELFYASNREALDALDRRLRASLRLEVVNSLQLAQLASDRFFDSKYHLIEAGRDECTGRMIGALRARGLSAGREGEWASAGRR